MSAFCRFCGTLPGNGEKACATEEEAFARSTPFPYGCAWFTHEDREPFLAKRWKEDSDGSWYRADALGYTFRVMRVDSGHWICGWSEKYPAASLRIGFHTEKTAEAAMKRMDEIAAEDHQRKVEAINHSAI